MTKEFYQLVKETIQEHAELTLPKYKVATSAHFHHDGVLLYHHDELLDVMPLDVYFKFLGAE